MKWRCQAYRGMDTFRQPVEVEADTSEQAAQKAMRLVPFGDVMQCEPLEEERRSPYGMENGSPRCVNAQPGTYGHECGKPAQWVGTDRVGFAACYCDACKAGGYEARAVTTWARIAAINAP